MEIRVLTLCRPASEPASRWEWGSCLDVSSAEPCLTGCDITLPHSAPSDPRPRNLVLLATYLPRAPEPARRAPSTPCHHSQYQRRNNFRLLTCFSLAVPVLQHNSTRHVVLPPFRPDTNTAHDLDSFFPTSFVPSFLSSVQFTHKISNPRPCNKYPLDRGLGLATLLKIGGPFTFRQLWWFGLGGSSILNFQVLDFASF